VITIGTAVFVARNFRVAWRISIKGERDHQSVRAIADDRASLWPVVRRPIAFDQILVVVIEAGIAMVTANRVEQVRPFGTDGISRYFDALMADGAYDVEHARTFPVSAN
jgi:predicted GNAT superfamily acetyltransferase